MGTITPIPAPSGQNITFKSRQDNGVINTKEASGNTPVIMRCRRKNITFFN